MPSLNWIGKESVVNHDKEVPFKLLEKVPSASVGKESNNLVIHGDNLEALKALMPFYKGKIKCIYIDPPYNTGNEGWTYNDKVNSPKMREWLGKVVGMQGEDLTRHDKWLCMMYPRLKLLRDLLSEDGAIYVQLDYNEVHYGKILLDEIFGNENFQREIIWRIGWISGYKSADKNWIRNHDTILFYSKNAKKLKFNKRYIPYSDKYVRRDGSKPTGRGYPYEDTWNASELDPLNSIAIISFSKEKFGTFKGQKNIELIQRIIRAHAEDGDIVLDSFAGTGSTGHAVLDLNKKDNTNLKFILVEMEDKVAKKITAERLKQVIKKNNYKNGFEFCELERPLFNAKGQINEVCSYNELASYVYFTETRTNINNKVIDEPFIGESAEISYYLIFKEKNKNDLTRSALLKLKIKGPAVIYADRCLVDEEVLRAKSIVFKQIPYEIKVY